MKHQLTLLLMVLGGSSLVNAQTPTTTSSPTSPTYTSPLTTDSTNAVNTTAPQPTDNSINSINSTPLPSTSSDVTVTTNRPKRGRAAQEDYKNFSYGIYGGGNTTKFKGEALDANGSSSRLTGRLGYQLGFFVRGGGRLYGQIGAEYFASSSNYFVAGSGQSAANISDQINIKYIQVPVYIGYKLTQSDRGISAVRVQLGLEYARQIGSSSNSFGSLTNFQIKTGSFNGLGQIGFDAGPFLLDLTYHHGLSNAISQNSGYAGSQRRILSASVGFKF